MVRFVQVVILTAILILGWGSSSLVKEITITLSMQAGMEEGWLDEIIRRFEDTHPGVKVIYEPVAGDYNTKIPAAILGGQAPDVLQGWGENQRGWAQSGFLLDLEPYVKKNPAIARDFFRAQWDALQFKSGPQAGMRYGIPMYVNALGGIMYNVNAFDDAGLTYPEKMPTWTWDDLTATAKKLTRSTGESTDRWGFGTITDNTGWIATWIWAAGGDLFSEDFTTYTGVSSNAIRGVQFVHDLIWQHGVTPPRIWHNTIGGPTVGFTNGKLAMMHTYAVWTKEVATTAQFDWNIAPNPVGPAGILGALTVADSFSVSSQTKHPDVAFELVMALTSREANLARLKNRGLIPALPSLGVEYYKTMPNKNLRFYLEAMEYARVDPRTFFPKPVEMNQLFVNIFTRVLVENSMTPAAGMESAVGPLQALMK